MIIIDDIEQGSPEWRALKAGIPSASNFDKICTTKGEPSKQSKGYMYELAAQVISDQIIESYTNQNMEEGKLREAESRKLYEMAHDVDVAKVAVVYQDEQKKYLCSPDGIVNGKYGLELKNPLPKTQVKYLLGGKLPTEYILQVQGSLFITGFYRWDFQSYVPGMPLLAISVSRDETLITKLESELHTFVFELDGVIRKLREMQ